MVSPPPFQAPSYCRMTPYASAVPPGPNGVDYTSTWFGAPDAVGGLWAGLDRAYGGNWYAGGLKVMWLRGTAGKLSITGYRSDGPGPQLITDVPEGYGDIGLQASELDFPTAGCWLVTATNGQEKLDFSVWVYPTGCRQSSWAHDPAAPQPCEFPGTGGSPVPGSNAAAVGAVQSNCPVTTPPDPPFVPPAPYNETSVNQSSLFWYGTPDLWTQIEASGIWTALPRREDGYFQQVFWWSTGYPSRVFRDTASVIDVTGRRLDGPAPPLVADQPTGVNSSILVGVTFPTSGCWEVTGTYQAHTLRFVVWVGDPASSTPTPSSDVTVAPLLLTAAGHRRGRGRQMKRSAMEGLSRKPSTWSQGGSG
jgi:hypothetical protein